MHTSLDMTAVSSKSASLRPSSLYFQRRVPRSTSNPDLPSPSLSPEEEMALAANGGLIPAGTLHFPNKLFYLYRFRRIVRQTRW